uniref:ShKT domain-containing protein n=1 Tax=Acrobeloides nanus TaxID=290746 RepID=A0A914DYJ9_9BILA
MKIILLCLISACLAQAAHSICSYSTLTQDDRDSITNAHNNYRSILAKGQANLPNGQFAPPAANMYKVSYDCDLENIAQNYAEKCVFQHSSAGERDGAGENLFMSTGNIGNAAALQQSADAWWGELEQYGIAGFASNDTTFQSNMSSVGHFTQMAWANSTKIGCGVQWCPNNPMTIVVCNYKDAGNYINSPIYQVGNACASDSECTSVPQSTCDTSAGLCSSNYVPPCADNSPAYACNQWQAAGYCANTSPYYPYVAQQECRKTCASC